MSLWLKPSKITMIFLKNKKEKLANKMKKDSKNSMKFSIKSSQFSTKHQNKNKNLLNCLKKCNNWEALQKEFHQLHLLCDVIIYYFLIYLGL